MNRQSHFLPILIILIGSGLRWQALARDLRFHPDEALFSTFARAAAIKGDWLLPGALDKPPLAIYANALSQVFVGAREFSARLPGVFASIVLMALLYALARQLYPIGSFRLASVPNITLTLTAFSPYAIAFSATALTDALMLVLMVAALWLAVRGSWLWSGVLLGLAFASKQQALYYLPLTVLVGAFMTTTGDPHQALAKALLRFIAGLAVVLAVLLVWDASRPEVSIFTLAAVNNDPGRLIRADEILPRLTAWTQHASLLLSYGWLTALLLIIAGGGLIVRLFRQSHQQGTIIDLLLCAYLLAYGWLHWLVAFNTYDRYLLPVLPLVILLAARGLSDLVDGNARPVIKAALLVLLSSVILLGGIQASRGNFDVNQEGERYRGIDTIAAYLAQQPIATVIYDHWLGWELDYYLGVWHDKRRVYYPDPQALVHDALQLCETGTRYFPVPVREPHQVWLEALEQAGFGIGTAFETPGFRVYSLTPPWSWADAASAGATAPGQTHPCGDAAP